MIKEDRRHASGQNVHDAHYKEEEKDVIDLFLP